MAKKTEESYLNLYNLNDGQASTETIDDIMKRKKAKEQKEREKRIKENNKKQQNEAFDYDTEMVINMTNKNNQKKEKQIKRINDIKQQKKEKKRKRSNRILKITLFLFVIVGIAVFAMVSPIFNIQEIQITDNNIVSSETIMSLSELKLGNNLFRFSKNDVKNKIKQNPYIDNVEIKRQIPSKILITVKERVPEYSLEYMGQYAIINNQGYILEIKDTPNELIIVKGILTDEDVLEVGKRLNEEQLDKLENIIRINNMLKENNFEPKITSININDKNEYDIYIDQEQKTVHLGDASNLSNKIPFILAIIEAEKGNKGEIFIDGNLNDKFRPYFRKSID